MGMVLDILVVGIIGLFVFTGFRRGLINTVVHFVSAAVSCLIASIAGSFISVRLYHSFVRQQVMSVIEKNMPEMTMNIKPEDISKDLTEKLPSFAKNALGLEGITQQELTKRISEGKSEVPVLVEEMIRPVLLKLLTIIVTLAIFTIIVAIISIATRSLTSALDISGLSIVNKLIGGLIGIPAAVVILMVISLVMYILIVFMSPESTGYLAKGIDDSTLFKLIYYNINVPEQIITRLINGG